MLPHLSIRNSYCGSNWSGKWL